MEELGTRFNFRTSPEIMEKIDDLYKKSGCATKAEFIEKYDYLICCFSYRTSFSIAFSHQFCRKQRGV